MKKKISYILLFFFFSVTPLLSMHVFPSFSSLNNPDSSYITDLSVAAALDYGSLDEYVYSGNFLLSELNWDLKPLVSMGGELSIFMFHDFYAGAGFRLGLNRRAGIVEDSDWVTLAEKTHYSRHDSVIDIARDADINAGYLLYPHENFSISFHLGFNFRHYRIEAHDGYKEYPPGSEKDYVMGTVMAYEQKYYIPYMAFQGEAIFFRKMSVRINAVYSPAVFCRAVDNHFLTNTDFYDSMNWGHYLYGAVGIGWKIDSLVGISMETGYCRVFEFRGDNYDINTITGIKSGIHEDIAGAGMNMFTMDIKLSFRIDWSRIH